ncbi:MAG TPA: glycoside hydrolase family 20 zincin-like fold domain-containing protein [Rhizomicrobium sp.]
MSERTTEMTFFRRSWAQSAAALLVLPLLVSCVTREPIPVGRQAHGPDVQTALTPALIPLPAQLAMQSGQFAVSDGTPLVFDGADADSAHIAAYFADLVRRTRGLTLTAQPDAAGAIALRRLADPNATGKEGYRLEVTPNGG